jgi:tRNA(Met) cytidine acetyltransferase
MNASNDTAQIPRSVPEVIEAVYRAARTSFHRYIVVFSGAAAWTREQAASAIQAGGVHDALRVSGAEVEHEVHFSQTKQLLGREFQTLIFDCHQGFDPDAFAVTASTVRGGGLLFLLTPPLDQFSDFADPQKKRIAIWPYEAGDLSNRFLRYFVSLLKRHPSVVLVQQNEDLPSLSIQHYSSDRVSHVNGLIDDVCLTPDQHRAVKAIAQVAAGHRHRPLVMTADRGRGKTASLGIATARLLLSSCVTILVTAPRLSAVTPLFDMVKQLCPDALSRRGSVTVGQGQVRFVPPDDLVREPIECHLLLVDEAAAIPAPLLERLLDEHSRIVFSTTVHGYEGTGRGFSVRFQRVLDERTPQWSKLRLVTPIRWAAGDPLESFVFDALLLDAEPAPSDMIAGANVESCAVERLVRDHLLQDKHTLHELFGLLVLAHYQTQPADLRYLLDGMELDLYVLRYNSHIVAVAMVEKEGAMEPQLAKQVYENRRRVHGHLMAQSLAVYGGFYKAPLLNYARIVRIAVHPDKQRCGLGARLVREIVADMYGVADVVGASFGAASDLLAFWRRCGFAPVHVGVTRNASSGMHAALYVKAVSEPGEELVTAVRQRFREHFPRMLANVYYDLDSVLVESLLWHGDALDLSQITQQDWKDIESFALAKRGFEVTSVPIWKLVHAILGHPDHERLLGTDEKRLLVAKVLQQHSWQEITRLSQRVSIPAWYGKTNAENALRQCIEVLYKQLRHTP